MTARSARAVALVFAGSVMVFTGCAKKPATTAAVPSPSVTQASAPAGSGPRATAPDGARRDGGAAPVSQGPARAAGPASGAARPSPAEFSAIADLRDVYFGFDKYDIRPQDADVLEANAKWLKGHPSYLVMIEGHADERGTDAYNLALAERRAKATAEFLVSRGVAASRLKTVSYGEERPACTEKNEGCWSKNRRAHFLVKAG